MGRPKAIPAGIESRTDADGITRFRGTLYTRATGRRRGPWTPNLNEAEDWRQRAALDARAGVLAHKAVGVREAIRTFTAGIEDGSIRNRSGQEFKPSVVRDYKRDLARVDRLIGARKLDEVRLQDAQRVVDRLAKVTAKRSGERLSDSSVRNTMMALRSMYAWACPLGLAKLNPCDGLRLPITDERKRERIAAPREAALLLASLSLRDRAALGLAFYAGLRAGEILALDWKSVSHVVTVERAWDPKAGFIPPKSKAAYRDVPVIEPLEIILEDYAAAGQQGLLFASQRSVERPFSARALVTRMEQRWQAAGLTPIGLHEARHTYASLLIAAGENAKSVTTYMGHSSVQVTFDRYGHLFPGNEAEARDRINAFLRLQMESPETV